MENTKLSSHGEKIKDPVSLTQRAHPITDKNAPLYGGSTVKLGYFQKPYILRDGVTYGSSLKLLGVQLLL